jgi:hypothetical protein
MSQISQLCVISDAEAARIVSPETHGDLTQRIATIPPQDRRPRTCDRRRLWRIALPLALGLAAAIVLATTIGTGGTSLGPVSLGPGSAQALSFRTEGPFIIVIVRNPVADLPRYRAELAAHHLNITLRLVPASPSLVGSLVEGSGPSSITPIAARGRCWTGGSGDQCPVGLKIPIDFHGSAGYTFGRAARPREQYETSAPATAPGEAMHGMRFRGQTVSAVLTMLSARHVTVPQYRWLTKRGRAGYSAALRPGQVPGNWHVYDAIPWARNQVLLFVGRPSRPPRF